MAVGRRVAVGRRLAVSFMALATAGLAAGCGGGNDGNVMRATLTDDGCTYEGDTTLAPGPFTVEVRNETRNLADFDLVELSERAKLEDIEIWFEKAREEYEPTGAPPDPPTQVIRRPVASSLVGPGATSELPGNEYTGRYAVMCSSASALFSDASNSPPFPRHVFAAAQLEVRR